MKLTKRSVEAIATAAKDVFIWDSELAGFGIRVKPSGVRSYLVQYRNSQGRSRRLTIGRHGVLTADQARKQAVQLLAAVRRGVDPTAERAALLQAPTINDLCDRYLAEHVAVHNRPRTAHEVRRLLDKHIRPTFGSLKAASLTRQDVIKLHRGLASKPRLANHIVAVLSKISSLAELWGVRRPLYAFGRRGPSGDIREAPLLTIDQAIDLSQRLWRQAGTRPPDCGRRNGAT